MNNISNYLRNLDSIEELSISNESIGSMLVRIKNKLTGRDEHGVKSSDKKPGKQLKEDSKAFGRELEEDYKKLKDVIKRYYLNAGWLSKQTLTTKDVSGKGISGPLNFNGKAGNDLLKNLNDGINWSKSVIDNYLPHVHKLNQHVQKIDATLNDKVKSRKYSKDEMIKFIEESIEEMKNLPSPYRYLPKGDKCGLGNKTLVAKKKDGRVCLVSEQIKPLVENETIKPLDQSQIVTVAEMILKLIDLDVIEVELSGWLDHSDGSELNEWFNDNEEDSLSHDYYSEYYHQEAWMRYEYGLDDLIDEISLAIALEKWIDSSISEEVSTETYEDLNLDPLADQSYSVKTDELEDLQSSQVALEAYLDMVSKSGPNGISKTSVAVMRLGLEHISTKHGLIKNNLGMEDFTIDVKSNLIKVKVATEEITNLLSQIDTKIENISVEGIGNLFGDIFRNMTKGRRPSIRIWDAHETRIKKLKDTYGNAAWLKDRRFVTGEVTFKGTPEIDKDLTQTMTAMIASHKKDYSLISKMMDDKVLKVIRPWVNFIEKKEYLRRPEAVNEMYTSFPEFTKEGKEVKTKSFFNNRKYDDNGSPEYFSMTRTALTEAEISVVIKSLIDYIDFYSKTHLLEVSKEWYNIFIYSRDGKKYSRYNTEAITDNGKYTDIGEAVNSFGSEDCIKLVESIGEHASFAWNFAEGQAWNTYLDYQRIVTTVMRWIEASTR